MPSSTRRKKENTLLFLDHACLECLIRQEKHTTSVDNRPTSSTDTCQQMSTDTTKPSTNTSHRSLIDTSQRTLVDTNPRVDMVSTLVLIHDENEDLHDQEGHMRNASVRGCMTRGL
ncbi:hypothetical protein F2Q70_00043122 [Brassica cretica]|uniref:Uncharacterized protein n=1 Tax=Brassica cretica TaxID=69181 RepID=A0A8S9KFS7_BRACR|nr:hypothetical protein F2Q70_00043122 [Brassica cretica]